MLTEIVYTFFNCYIFYLHKINVYTVEIFHLRELVLSFSGDGLLVSSSMLDVSLKLGNCVLRSLQGQLTIVSSNLENVSRIKESFDILKIIFNSFATKGNKHS